MCYFHNITKSSKKAFLFYTNAYRLLKELISGLGANVSKETVTKVSQCIGPLHDFIHNYEHVTKLNEETDKHSKPHSDDISKMVSELLEANVFHYNGQTLHAYKTYTPPLHKENRQKFNAWLLATAKASIVF